MEETERRLPQVEELIGAKRWQDLRDLLAELPVPDIAELLVQLERSLQVVLFRLLPRSAAAEVFSYLESPDKDRLLQNLSSEEATYILDNLPPDDRTEFFEDLPGIAIQRLLNLLSPGELLEARKLLGYPRESVGRLMTPDYVALRENWTIETALAHIRRVGRESETINSVFVIDDRWHLLDDIQLRQLILAEPTASVGSLMDGAAPRIGVLEDREKAVEVLRHYDVSVLPVVDEAGVLLGIVTADDLLDVAEEEATEDIHLGAGVEPLRTSYREAGVFALYRKRIVWLAALLVVGLASGGVIAMFEDTLASTIALAFFLPLLMGSAGNTGAQSSTLVVRAIATGELETEEWLRTLGRELGIGLLLAGSLAAAVWWAGLLKGGVEVAFVIAAAMFAVVFVTNLIGVVIPLTLTKLGIDPAVASNPLISSIADVSCLLIYFSIARMVLF